MEKVAVVECSSYDMEVVYLSVQEALQKISFEVPDGITVLIKPNIMSQNIPEQHTITHYSVIDTLCRILEIKKCKILIGESIAFYQKGLTTKAFTTSKIMEVAEKYGARLIAFEEEPLAAVKSDTVLKELYIPKILLDTDMIINVGKLKTHGGLRLSGALKNMFGCLPGGYKQRIHMWTQNNFELSEVFIDIHNLVKPAVSILDAVISLDGGPSAIGKQVHTSAIIASQNAAAVDIAACRIIGYDPSDISTLLQAREKQMIRSFDDIEVLGNIIPKKFKKLVKGEISRHKPKDSIFVKYTYVSPVVSKSKCISCGNCVTACPVGAIRKTEKAVLIDSSTCINCYYCVSVCLQRAVVLKSSVINKVMRAVRYILKL